MSIGEFNRRKFIGSSVGLIQLPFLQSFMAGPASAQAVAPARAKKLVFLGMGFGVTRSSWFPDINDTGKGYKLPKGLSPLARHQGAFSVIQNLTHEYSRNGHAGSTFWLTGANQNAVPGKSFHNTISVDQVAAHQLGLQTRFSSMTISGSKTQTPASGHGPGLSLSWDDGGKPVAGLMNPLEMYHRLFSNPTTSIQEQKAMIADKRSVLDAVFSDVKSIHRKINHEDRQKLEEYVQSLRDIEIRLAKDEKWIGVPKKQPALKVSEPQSTLEGKKEIEMIYDLMVAAMQVDASRVFSYRLPADTFLQSIGGSVTAHNMSHYSERGGAPKETSERRDKAHAELLAGFFDKLFSSKTSNGQTLFHDSTVVFGSNISSLHNLDNCPTLVAGGGAGFTQGRHIVAKEEQTPLCNLWLSLLKGSGVKADSFGDSTGVLEELRG